MDDKQVEQRIKEIEGCYASQCLEVEESHKRKMKEITDMVRFGIQATDGGDNYSVGMRNGMRWCLSIIDGKAPCFDVCRRAPWFVRLWMKYDWWKHHRKETVVSIHQTIHDAALPHVNYNKENGENIL